MLESPEYPEDSEVLQEEFLLSEKFQRFLENLESNGHRKEEEEIEDEEISGGFEGNFSDFFLSFRMLMGMDLTKDPGSYGKEGIAYSFKTNKKEKSYNSTFDPNITNYSNSKEMSITESKYEHGVSTTYKKVSMYMLKRGRGKLRRVFRIK
jgi:hypothetical protein